MEKAKALSVVSEAMRFVLLDAGIHVNKSNMRKELPMDDIDWENYKYHWKSIKPNKEEFWIVVGQLIFIRDNRQKALFNGDLEEADRLQVVMDDYNLNLVSEYLANGHRPHRK